MDFDVNELLKKNSGIEPPTATPTEPLPPPTVAKEPMTAAPATPAGPDINDIIAKNTGEIKPGVIPPGPESPGLLGQVPIGVKLGMRNAVVTAARAFDPGSVLSGMGIDPNSPENREALANAPATREERAKVAEKGMTEAMFPHGVPEAKGLGEQVVRGLSESWPTLAALALTGGFGTGAALEEMAAPVVKAGVEVAPGLISKTAQTIGSAALPFGIMGTTDEDPAAGALKGGVLGATLGGMHLATKGIEKPLYQWLAKIGGGGAIGGGATAIAGGGAEEISRDAIIFGLFEAMGMPEQKKNPNSIIDPLTGSRVYPSSPYPGLDLGKRLNSLQGKVSDSTLTILKDPKISTESPEFIGAIEDVAKALKPEPEARVEEAPTFEVKKAGREYVIPGVDMKFSTEDAARAVAEKLNAAEKAKAAPPEAVGATEPTEPAPAPEPPKIPTPEELAGMSEAEIKALADQLESAGINGSMFSLKEPEAAEAPKSAFDRLMELRQQAKPEEAPRRPEGSPLSISGSASEALGARIEPKPVKEPEKAPTLTPPEGENVAPATSQKAVSEAKGPTTYEEDGWWKIPGDDRVFADKAEADAAAAKKAGAAPTPFVEMLTGKKPEPRTADELADAVENFNEPPERSGRTPGLDKLMVELGQTAVPGLRMSDAPEAANMYLALKRGELTPEVWDAYVEELKAQNRVKGYTPPEKPVVPVSTAGDVTQATATAPRQLSPEEARAAFMKKMGLDKFNFGTSRVVGKPTGQLTEGLAPGFLPGERPSPNTPGVSLHDSFPREQVTVNPDLWQHKLANTGAGQALKHIQNKSQWDYEGVKDIYLYRFPDGHVELMDGHSRTTAGDRVGIKDYPSVIFDGNTYSVEEARATAALINIKRGTGTVVDSAKAIRDLGLTREALVAKGVDLNSEASRIVTGLVNLSEPLFTVVAKGDFPAKKGAIIGELLQGDFDAQEAIYRLIAKNHTDKDGTVRISDEKLKNDIRFAEFSKVMPTKQPVLGEEFEDFAKANLVDENSDLMTSAARRLARAKSLFKTVTVNADRLVAAGNELKPEANLKLTTDAAIGLAILDKAAFISGTETNRLFNEYAIKLSEAKSNEKTQVKDEFYAKLPEALEADRDSVGFGESPGRQLQREVAASGAGTQEPIGSTRESAPAPGEPAGPAEPEVDTRTKSMWSLKENGQLGLFDGSRPLTKFEQRMNGIIDQYGADPERVAAAMRATPKASDREIAGMAKMAPEEASKVVKGTMTALERAELAKRQGGVTPGLFGEPAPGGPGGLFAEPEGPRAPERSFAPKKEKEVVNATEQRGTPESAAGEQNGRGNLPEDGTGREREVADFQSRIGEGLVGDGSDAENTFWGGLDLKPPSEEFHGSPAVKALREKAKAKGVDNVILVKEAPFDSVLVNDNGKRSLVVAENVSRGTHRELTDHEFFHRDLESGDPKAQKFLDHVNRDSQAFVDYWNALNEIRAQVDLPALNEEAAAVEIAADASSGLTRRRNIGEKDEIDLREVFHEFDKARDALVEYRGEEGLPGRMEEMEAQVKARPPNYFKEGDKIINTRGGDGINRAAVGEVGVVRAVRVRHGTADGRVWLEVKWNKSGVDHNVVGDDVDLPKERAGDTLKTQVAAAHATQFRRGMENTGLSYLLDMSKSDALAEIKKLKEYWDGQKEAWKDKPRDQENLPRSYGNADYIEEGNKILGWQRRLTEAEKTINSYVKNVMARDKDELSHLRTAEPVVTKVGKRTLTQETLFSLREGEERQGYVTSGEPGMSQKEFESELLKDRGELDKMLREPGSRLIPLYEGERWSGTRAGDKIKDAKGRLLEITPADLYERFFKPTKPQLPAGTETTGDQLLGKPGETTAPGVVEEPPSGYFGKLLRSVREKFSAANISEKADLAHSFIVKNLGWMAREMRKAVKVLDPFNDRFSKMTQEEMLKFTDMAESNSMAELTRMAFDPNSDFDVSMLGAASAWRRMADGLHFLRSHINESLQEDARAAGKPVPDLETAYWENYFPRLFKNPEDAAAKIQALLKSRGRSLTGPESFENPRSQLLFSDSIKPVAEGGLGLEPLDGNYINMMKANVWEQLRFLTGKYIEGDLKEAGFLSNKETPGWEKLKGDKTLEGYYAQPDVARVLDNFMSKGLRGDPLFELYNSPVTFINTVLVGLSAFHATFSTFSDLAHGVGSNLTRGIGAALTGRFSLAGHHMAELARAANVPLNLIKGGKFIEEYESPGTHTGEKYGETGTIGEIVDLMQKGGIRVNSEELSQVSRSFSEVLRDDKMGLPRKVVEAIAWPIMSYMVPRIKINATARLLQMELDTLVRDGKMKDMSQQDLVKLAQDVSRKSDNIFGQMVYDNLSMTRGLRDAMRILVGFPGWNIGSFTDILQAGKGIVHGVGEAGKAGAEFLTGQKPTWEAMSRQHRMSLEFYLGTVLTMAVFGAITQRLLTGEWPGDAKDLLMPKTGALMANGQAERIRPPTYMRDVLSLSHPIEMAKHKLNFPLRMFSALTDNQDFFGEQIRDPYSSAGTQVKDTAKYVGKSLLPFGIQGYLATESSQAKAMNLIGVTKVPRLYSNTPAMNVMDDYNKQNRAATTSKQAGEEKRLKSDLRKLAGEKDEKGFRLAAATAMKEGTLTHQQIKSIVDESKEPTPGLGRFKALPVEWQVRAWNVASPEEQAAWKPIFLKKVMAAKPEILIRNKEALVPVLQDMGLGKAAKMVEGLAISDKKASSLDLSALGIRKPENKMSSDSVIDSALSDTIREHLDKLGEEKTPKGFKKVSVKEKKRPYSALGF